ncbi:hypothetical protein JCM11641_005614 [Rhodosporidiobolus odoratus]
MLETMQHVASLGTVAALSVLVAVFAILPFLISHLRYPRALGTKPRPDLYTPKGALPFLGHQLRVLSMRDRQPELWVQLSCERSREGVKDSARATSDTVLGRRFVSLTRPEHLHHIQLTNFENYAKGSSYPILFCAFPFESTLLTVLGFYPSPGREQRRCMGQVLGTGIFTSDGDLWSIQRKATSKIFSNNAYRNIISTSIYSSVDKLLAVVGTLGDDGKEIKLSKLFFSLTLDTFCEMAYSALPGALDSEKAGTTVPFAIAFDYTQLVMSRRFQQPLWPLTELLDGTRSKMKAATVVVHSYANDLIKQRKAELQSKEEKGDVGGDGGCSDLLTMFLRVRDEDGKGLDKETLRDATINLLIAGRDTTAGTLAWASFYLLSRPEAVNAIREEAKSLGDNLKPGILEYDQLKDMSYTTAVWSEAARLHPSVPVNFWTALGDDQIPNGPRVEKGEFVGWCDWAAGRDKGLWGEDAGAFKPVRWLDETGRFRKESEYLMHSFNGGRRRPPTDSPSAIDTDETLATFEGVSVLLAPFSNFDLSFAPDYLAKTEMLQTDLCDEPTPRYQNALTLPMLEPLRVVAKRRVVETA